MFSTRLDNLLPFSSNLKLSSANSFSLEESKICRLVMGKPREKILDPYKLKLFADYNLKVDPMFEHFFDRVENILGKGEN